MIIVNADDFGLSTDVNDAIIESFKSGIITSTTIMANMPAFEEAVELAHSNDLSRCTGIHLNLTDGEPLTDSIRRCSKLCDSAGNLCFQRFKHLYLTKKERLAVTEEVRAQIQRCRDSKLCITHADSHHHVHTELPIFLAITPALKEFGVKSIRRSRNVGSISLPSRVYKGFFNTLLSMQGMWSTSYFGNVEEFIHLRDYMRAQRKSFEVMVHPGKSTDGKIIDLLDDSPLSENLPDLLEGFTLSPYPGNAKFQ